MTERELDFLRFPRRWRTRRGIAGSMRSSDLSDASERTKSLGIGSCTIVPGTNDEFCEPALFMSATGSALIPKRLAMRLGVSPLRALYVRNDTSRLYEGSKYFFMNASLRLSGRRILYAFTSGGVSQRESSGFIDLNSW